jgi:hypothetical protein
MKQADYMDVSGNMACQSLPIIAKFLTFEQLYWLNQVTHFRQIFQIINSGSFNINKILRILHIIYPSGPLFMI